VFDPISTAFARAFPLAQVFMIGANDPAANPHGPNESVLIPAVAKSAAQTAKIVLALKDVAFVRVAGEGAVVDETAEVGAEIETKAAEEVVLETEAQIVEEVEAQADAEIVEEVTVETEAAIVEEVVAETEAAIVEEAAVEMEVAVEAEASTVEETAPGASADAEVVEVVVTEERVVEAAIPDATTEAAPEEFTEVATEASVHASGIDDMEEYSHPKHLVQEDDPYLTYEQGLVEPPITTENQGEAPFEFV
jgi:excinuclease UvrABC ATPase subunit